MRDFLHASDETTRGKGVLFSFLFFYKFISHMPISVGLFVTLSLISDRVSPVKGIRGHFSWLCINEV